MPTPDSIRCHHCQHLNPPDARFCERCDTELASPDAGSLPPATAHQITVVDASSGGMVAIGSGARAITVDGAGHYVESQTVGAAAGPAPVPQACANCGRPFEPDDQYCADCGAKR